MPALPHTARRSFFALLVALASLAVLGLSGCASVPASQASALPVPPTLRLPPAQLAQAFEAIQHMQVQTHGKTRGFDVLLEANHRTLQLAVLQLSQTIAVIAWDGQQLSRTLAPGWPEVIPAEQLVSELQYVWWPLQSIQAALPSGDWQLHESANHRQLKNGAQTVLDIRSTSTSAQDGTITLVNLAQHYTVVLQTQGALPSFAAHATPTQEAP